MRREYRSVQSGPVQEPTAVGYSQRVPRPWNRPPQFQHGFLADSADEVEDTACLVARLSMVRAWEQHDSDLAEDGRPPSNGFILASEGTPEASAYLTLVDEMLCDGSVSRAAVSRLRRYAAEWGIGALEARYLEGAFIAYAAARAASDRRNTRPRLPDVERLARLLGAPTPARIPVRTPRRAVVAIGVSRGVTGDDADPSRRRPPRSSTATVALKKQP